MIIVSQEQNEIVNFNNVVNIMITDIDDEFVISAVALVGTDDIYRELGYYKTEERAKEIVKEIAQSYLNAENYKYVNSKMTVAQLNDMQKGLVYEMPKE